MIGSNRRGVFGRRLAKAFENGTQEILKERESKTINFLKIITLTWLSPM